MLGGTYMDFQDRPSDNQYLSIYFPPNEYKARFIWLHFNGNRGNHDVDNQDLARYVPGSKFGRFIVCTYPDIEARECKIFMIIEHDDNMVGNNQPVNLCLLRNIGPHATR